MEKNRHGAVAARGRWLHDGEGRFRIDYFDPPELSRIWLPAEATLAWLLHPEKTARIEVVRPIFPRVSAWSPNGRWTFSFTGDSRDILGIACQRVLIDAIEPSPASILRDELWASSSQGLVLLDVVKTEGEEREWALVHLAPGEPEPAAFVIPGGYRRIEE